MKCALDFDPVEASCLPNGWVRDYFFAANGYEKDMDFYAADGDRVEPLPFRTMGDYPYPQGSRFRSIDAHLNYLLEYNTRYMSGNEAERILRSTTNHNGIRQAAHLRNALNRFNSS